tara:strand:- start:247 stop:411 length:165 start_codon:yes stop_codon:yes gene_type:complete
MNIKNAKYINGTAKSIKAEIDDVEMHIPLDPNNRHYAEILKQVAEGKLTIKDAD